MKRYAPFLLVFFVILADQLTKLWVINTIPVNDWTQIKIILGNDFLRFIHVKNPGIALSIGQGFPSAIRMILFKIVPIPVMGYLGYLIINIEKEKMPHSFAWLLAGVMGGGIGNLIDRIFRPDGVVDWIDVKFYGILGWERFPTFNVADSFVFVSAIIMGILYLRISIKQGKNNGN